MDSIAVKVFHGQEARRFSVSNGATYVQLVQQVVNRFGLSSPADVSAMRFKDDEEELCVLSSDEELAEALRIAASTTPPILRVHLEVHVSTTAPETAVPELESVKLAQTGQRFAETSANTIQHFAKATSNTAQQVAEAASNTVQHVADATASTVQPVAAMASDVLEQQIIPAVQKMDEATGLSEILETQIYPAVESTLANLDQQFGASTKLENVQVAISSLPSTIAEAGSTGACGASDQLKKVEVAVTTTFSTAAPVVTESVQQAAESVQQAVSVVVEKVQELDQATGLSESVNTTVVPKIEAAMCKVDETTGISNHMEKVGEVLHKHMSTAAPHINAAGEMVEEGVKQAMTRAGPTIESGLNSLITLATAVVVSVGSTIDSSRGHTVDTPNGLTVGGTGGSTVQCTSGSTVELSSGRTVEIPSGRTVEIPAKPSTSEVNNAGEFYARRTQLMMKAATTMMKPEMSAAFSSWQSVPAEERTVDEPAVEEPMTESLIVDVASIRRLEMAQLHEMGFVDEDANRTALDTAGGNVSKAVELLTGSWADGVDDF